MKKSIAKILFFWLVASLIVPNVALSVTESLPVLARIVNVVLPLGVLGMLSVISRRIGITALCMLPLMVFASFQIVLLSLYGNGIISVDMFLNVLTTNCGEACELLSRLWPSLIVLSLIYLPPLVMGVFCICNKDYLSGEFLKIYRRVFFSIALAGAVLLGFCYWIYDDYDVRLDLYPVNIGYNLYLTDKREEQTEHYYETSGRFNYDAMSKHDSKTMETYIVVIGETSRAANWELLGYGRDTNPCLSQRDDLILASQAYSESNTTHKSVPMLLSCVDARSFDKKLYKVKSMISAFKECGFHTAFISNQLPNHSYIDFFGEEADSTIFVKLQPEYDGNDTDESLLRYVDKCLEQGHDKQLIVLHTYGSHFDYLDRYDYVDRVFVPDDYCKASRYYRKELINAYDNTIVATDHFLSNLISRLEYCHNVGGLLYTSDHGEDIFDGDSNKFLHASPTPTEYQLHVPFLVWLSPEYSARYPEVGEKIRENCGNPVSTSRSFCATTLSVGGVWTSMIDAADDLASDSYKVRDLYYLDDHNNPLPFKVIDNLHPEYPSQDDIASLTDFSR